MSGDKFFNLVKDLVVRLSEGTLKDERYFVDLLFCGPHRHKDQAEVSHCRNSLCFKTAVCGSVNMNILVGVVCLLEASHNPEEIDNRGFMDLHRPLNDKEFVACKVREPAGPNEASVLFPKWIDDAHT